MIYVISEKTLRSKDFTSNFRDILYENGCNYKSYRLGYKFAFILFLVLLTNQKQESGFQQVDVFVIRMVFLFLFIANRALLQSHPEFNRNL